MHKNLVSPIVLEISPLLFERLLKLIINKRFIRNADIRVLSFPLHMTCTSTCRVYTVAL